MTVGCRRLLRKSGWFGGPCARAAKAEKPAKLTDTVALITLLSMAKEMKEERREKRREKERQEQKERQLGEELLKVDF